MNKQIIASMVIGLFAAFSIAADDALPPEQIRAGEAKQTQIKAQTQNVAAQLGAIIDEFKRNGLDGQDVEVLEAIRRVLGKLSDEEMKKVIDALQEARSAPDASQSKKAFAGAVSDQKAIIAQLKGGADFATLAKSFGLYGEGPIVDPDDIRPALERGVKLAKEGKLALIDTITQPR